MKTPNKNIRVRKHQIAIIVEEMERNKPLNANKCLPNYSANQREADWKKLVEKLNSTGGAIKNAKAWKKCWTDFKSELKIKFCNYKKAIFKTGEGLAAGTSAPFSPLDERVLQLMGLEVPDIKPLLLECMPTTENIKASPVSELPRTRSSSQVLCNGTLGTCKTNTPRKRVKRNQIVIIVEEMERNKFLNANKLLPNYSASQKQADWKKLVEKLNSAEGATKNMKAWQKCWTDCKCEVNKKLRTYKKDMFKTGGGHAVEITFSPLDERILQLMGHQVPEINPLPLECTPTTEDVISCPISELSRTYSGEEEPIQTPQLSSINRKRKRTSLLVVQDESTEKLVEAESEMACSVSELPRASSSQEEPNQTPQLSSINKKSKRTSPLVVQDESAEKLVEAQCEIAEAIQAIAGELKTANAIKLEEIKLKRRKVEAFEGILDILKNRFSSK